MPASSAPALRQWTKRLAWALAGLAVLLLALWWGVPALLLWQAPPRLSQALGRPVTISAVSWAPWRLEFLVDGLRVGGPGRASEIPAANPPASSAEATASTAAAAPVGAKAAAVGPPPLLQIAHLRIELSIASLRHGAPVVQALAIDGLRLHLARTAPGHYDIDDLLARFAPVPAPGSAEPARFALYNLALTDAHLRLDDRPADRVHTLDALTLTLPFLSNLPADVAVRSTPRLAFTLNGTRIDSGSQALPFASTRSGELTLAFADLDLRPWLAYLPAGLPLRLAQARLTSDLTLRFALPPQGPPSVSLLGSVALRDVALTEPDGTPLLRWNNLTLALQDVQPLLRKIDLGVLQIDGAELQVARDTGGRLNLQRLLAPAGAAPVEHNTAAPQWQLHLAALRLSNAQLRWTDAAVQPAAALQLDGLAVQIGDLRWPAPSALPVSLSATLRAQRAGAPAAGQFSISGQANDQQAALALQITGFDLATLAPYLAQTLQPRLSGQLALQAGLAWAAQPARLALTLDSATLQDAALRDTGPTPAARQTAPLASVRQVQMARTEVDLLARQVRIGSLQLQQPGIALARDAAGQLNVASWLGPAQPAPAGAPGMAPVGAGAAPAGVAPASAASASAASAGPLPARGAAAEPPAWRVQLQDLSITGGRLQWADARVSAGNADPAGSAQPLRIELGAVRLRLQGFSWPPAPVAAGAAAGAGAGAALPQLQLAARISSPQDGDGQGQGQTQAGASPDSASGDIDWTGRFALAPLQLDGRLQLRRLPVHRLVAYAGSAVPVALLHADAGFQGRVQARLTDAGWQASTDGDLQINELQLNNRPQPGQPADSGEALLSWQSLALQGLALTLAPPAKPRIEVREIALDDFYSRLMITEDGRFNLQSVAAPGAAASAPAGAVEAKGAAAAVSAEPAASAALPPTTAAAPPTDLPITLVLGPSTLRNGRIDFSDHFVRPNYSVRLTDLAGQIGALRSDSRDMASISLRGRAAQTALIDISGQINPTARPLALDIRARATDLELAPLSPYAGKYAGYAIERGKLSMDVAYKIDADGKLLASNQVVLNQLTFGERVESPSATQLPVLLAVALLKDRNGVIDINLPVSGSVNDPQFSLGGIIWKIILNLLGKALTAPFSLLAGGGTDDLSLVEFMPGSARLTDTGQQALAKVAGALVERPALKMTVTGAADPASEREALQHALLDERLLAERQRERLRAGLGGAAAGVAGPAAAPAPSASAPAAAPAPSASAPAAAVADTPPLSAAERARLLKAVYQQTALPAKPRNALGLLRSDLPAPEMEALLLAHQPANDDSLRELALQRGLAVRDALIRRGLPSERLFIAAPKLRAAGEGDAAWTPRVQLSLSTQ